MSYSERDISVVKPTLKVSNRRRESVIQTGFKFDRKYKVSQKKKIIWPLREKIESYRDKIRVFVGRKEQSHTHTDDKVLDGEAKIMYQSKDERKSKEGEIIVCISTQSEAERESC